MIDKIVSLGYTKLDAIELLKVSKNIEEDYKLLLQDYPIQYLIGYVNFYGNKIDVNNNVLIPRFETELLVEKTINYSKRIFKDKIDILDLCTGSGAIAISLKKEIDCNVLASDISKDALNVAKNNALCNNLKIDFIESNMLDKIEGKYDIVICNPPYIDRKEKIMDKVKKYEPEIALFAEDNGLYFYKKLFSTIKRILKNKYIIAMEIGCEQGNTLLEEAKKYFNCNIILEQDYTDRDRYLFIINE